MIDKDKQREFLEMLLGAVSEDKTDKNKVFAKQSFELFNTLVAVGFTEEQAMSLLGAVLIAATQAKQ